MSEEHATAEGTSTATPARRTSAATSRRRGSTEKTADATGGPALPPQRDDPFQAAPRIWPD